MKRVNLRKIRELRKRAGLTQSTMAQALGYKSAIGYHYLETGRCKVKIGQLYAIAARLGVTIDDLLEEPAEVVAVAPDTA